MGIVTVCRPSALQFIIDELTERGEDALGNVVRNKYGCRVVQRLLEHACAEQMRSIVEVLLTDTVAISTNSYGKYVMQHVLAYGTDNQRRCLISKLSSHISAMTSNCHGCAVITSALARGGEDRAFLAWAIIEEPEVAVAMSCSRYGY